MTGAGSLSLDTQPVTDIRSPLLLSGRCGVPSKKGSAETSGSPAGEAFPLLLVQMTSSSVSNRGLVDFQLSETDAFDGLSLERVMTRTARQVLIDCEIALEMLEAEQDLVRWRVHWAGALALLRAVGHVLHKVDSADPKVRHQVDVAYDRWKSNKTENAIFWEFIEQERNNILKEYRFNLHPLDQVDVAVTMTAHHPDTGEIVQLPQMFPIRENIYRPILDGYSEGDDARDVYREALNWWKTELTAIEHGLSECHDSNT